MPSSQKQATNILCNNAEHINVVVVAVAIRHRRPIHSTPEISPRLDAKQCLGATMHLLRTHGALPALLGRIGHPVFATDMSLEGKE